MHGRRQEDRSHSKGWDTHDHLPVRRLRSSNRRTQWRICQDDPGERKNLVGELADEIGDTEGYVELQQALEKAS